GRGRPCARPAVARPAASPIPARRTKSRRFMNAPVGGRTHRSAATDCRGGRPACRPAIILTPNSMPSRRLIPLALLVAGVAAIALAFRRSESEAGIGPLRWIATAHQFVPVGYRDPAGAISPDGQWIAYSEGRLL